MNQTSNDVVLGDTSLATPLRAAGRRPTSFSRSAALAVLGLVGLVIIPVSAPVTTGCAAGCDPAAECVARNGAPQASIEPSDENVTLCDETAQILRAYTGSPPVESGLVIWSNDPNEGWQCECFYPTVGHPLEQCAYKVR